MTITDAELDAALAERAARRARADKDAARKDGILREVYGGAPPLGFAQPRDHRGRPATEDWVVDQAETDYLNEAADGVLAGVPLVAVHAELARRWPGITLKQLRAALGRPATAGLITARDDTRADKTRGHGPVIGQAKAGGPLTRAKWEAVQDALARHARRGTPGKPGRYWAGPLLRCGRCGNTLTGDRVVQGYAADGKPDQWREYYACRNPHDGITPCRGVSVQAAEVHHLLEHAAGSPAGWDALSPAGKRDAVAARINVPVAVAAGNGGARRLTAAQRINLETI